jgi:hypothetical protein
MPGPTTMADRGRAPAARPAAAAAVWAEQRGKTFGTAHVEKQFKLTRGHASMVLSKLARDGGIRRVEAREGRPRQARHRQGPGRGSLPARILQWAAARGKPFGNTDIEKQFKLTRGHASMVTSTLAKGPHPIERTGRGVYEDVGNGAGAVARKVTKKKRE